MKPEQFNDFSRVYALPLNPSTERQMSIRGAVYTRSQAILEQHRCIMPPPVKFNRPHHKRML